MKRHRDSKFLVFFTMVLILASLSGNLVSSSYSSTVNASPDQNRSAIRSSELSQYSPSPSSTPILYLSNLTTLQYTARQITELANMSIIQSITSYLSSFDNRYTGTQGSIGAISYIKGFFTSNCSIQKVYLDNFTFNDGGAMIQASNIIAKIDAANPTSKTLLVTAHHDSIGYQYPFNFYSTGAKGADDDASGVGAALETARVLSMFKGYLRYNVLFIIFAAEEGNKTLDSTFMRQGSTSWISGNHMGVGSLSDLIGVVNLDEVAYRFGGTIGAYYYSSGKNVALNLTSTATMLNIPIEDEGHARTDSYVKPVRCRTENTFDNTQVPAVTLSTHNTNPFAHTSQDTLSNLDFKLACNFTKIVLSYVYLTCGSTPKPVKTYSASWSSALRSKTQYIINETNYIDILMKPSIIAGYQLVILDPSLSGMSASSLSSITSACFTDGKRLPILSLGRTGVDLLHTLTENEIESTGQNTSKYDLVAYLERSLTSVLHHPVFNSPNNITLTIENDTVLSYKIEKNQANGLSSMCYLVREVRHVDPSFLQLGNMSFASKLWTWLGMLHTHNTSCGPVAFIGMEDASVLTDAAKAIIENTVYWLLNGPKTAATLEPSEGNPLVGDHVRVNFCLRSSLTWQANSSVPVSLTVISPSGNRLFREMHVTNHDGIAESSTLFLAEIGEYKVNGTILVGGEMSSSLTMALFNSGPRINVRFGTNEIHVTQGESTDIRLDLGYMPTSPDNMTLTLGGSCLSSNVSVGVSFNHGYSNLTLTITAREAVQPGEYNLTLRIMPATREYVACEQLIRSLVAPGYDIEIIEAPTVMVQGSRSEVVLQVRSHRSIAVSYNLRIETSSVMVVGEIASTISAGATQQISLPLEEASTSPYSWGEGTIQVALVRNGFPVAKSPPLTVSVSISPINLFLGYILPPALLLTFVIDRLRRANVRRVAIGTVLGGSAFFMFGLLISQSMLMAFPLAMLVVGSYVGSGAARYIYDKPLPRGYDWLLPSEATVDKRRNRWAEGKGSD